MKKALRTVSLITAFGIIAALGMLAYIRLAPSDPAVWHVSPVTTAKARQGGCADTITPGKGGARAACLSADSAETVLSRLDQIALATPRTSRLHGTPQTGRITWVTRSALMGYPDYTTAEVAVTPNGTRLDIYARQRFGQNDWGVNAARLKIWLGGS